MMEKFGFNERAIIEACATILSAHRLVRLVSFKPYPAVYFPAGWVQDHANEEKYETPATHD